MKFSLTLLKKLVPVLKNKKEIIEKLNLHFFEVEDGGGDILEIAIPSNRFSDAASHWGIAREISAILGKNFQVQNSKLKIQNFGKVEAPFRVLVQDKNLCLRYAAQYFENVKIGPSPKWLQKILIDCGLRPINNVVDIMNYAMLETGQPLHAFDFDKIRSTPSAIPQIIVRKAKEGEKITTLDGKNYHLNESILVIADEGEPLAIAGIKGGKKAEVDKSTKRIIVESANFRGVNIYQSSRWLNLFTDASLRFSHNISPELTIMGLSRANQLLQEVIGAKPGLIIDKNFTKSQKKIISFDVEKFNKFIGINLDSKTCQEYLKRLGFLIIQNPKLKIKNSFLVEVSPLRQDIEIFEDLAEEIIRLYGFNRLKSVSPHIHLQPSGFENQIILKDKIKKVLTAVGLNEVYNYSFISSEEAKKFLSYRQGPPLIELENPISNEFKYLRPSLASHLIKNINSNFRFFEEVRIFEIGKIFFKDEQEKFNEKLTLGIALSSKNKGGEIFFELKGIIEKLFKKVGLVNYLMPESKNEERIISLVNNFLIAGEVLKIESDEQTLGYLGRLNRELTSNYEGVLAEIDLELLLKLVEEEHEYRPLPKYPSVMRDISILVEPTRKVGEIMQAIQEVDLKYIEDVDLIDEFDFEESKIKGQKLKARSLTFRIVFQAQDRTLTDREVNEEMEKIVKLLKTKFKVKIR